MQSKASPGVALIEFVIVFPVLMLILLAFVDFGRYVAAQSILESAANRALLLASTIDDIDNDKEDTEYKEAETRVLETATRLVGASFIGLNTSDSGLAHLKSEPTLIRPTPQAGQTMKDALQSSTMSINLEATITPFLPFLPKFTVAGKAVGFREPRSEISLPIPVDCKGNPIGSEGYFSDCPCDGVQNSIWNEETRECEACLNGKQAEDGSCRCPTLTECQQQLGPRGYVSWYGNAENCNCKCGGGAGFDENGQCNCLDGKIFQSISGPSGYGVCQCLPEDQVTQEQCEQKYPGLPVSVTADKCRCFCDLGCGPRTGPKLVQRACACECVDPEKFEWTGPDSGCECKNRDQAANCASGYVWDEESCSCLCNLPCNSPGSLNTTDCTCSCGPGITADASGNCPDIGGGDDDKEIVME